MAYQNIIGTKLAQGALVASNTILYTSPTNPSTRTYVKDIDISNTSATATTVSVYLVPLGSSAAASNALFYSVSLPGYSTLQWTGAQILNPGDSIQASAANSSCTISISGGQAT
jgi:hypothetical protein